MHRHEYDEREEHEGVRRIEGGLSQPEEEIQTDDRHHAPPVQEVVLHGGGEHIGECSDANICSPDHRIVVVIAVDGHKVIERKHKGEDCPCGKHGLYDVIFFGSLCFLCVHSLVSLHCFTSLRSLS